MLNAYEVEMHGDDGEKISHRTRTSAPLQHLLSCCGGTTAWTSPISNRFSMRQIVIALRYHQCYPRRQGTPGCAINDIKAVIGYGHW